MIQSGKLRVWKHTVRYFWVATIVSAMAISCANPKTAAEYRKVAESSMFGKVDKFIATQDYGKVVQILKSKSAECLNYKIERSGGGQVSSTMTVTAKFSGGAKQSELVVNYEDVVHNITGDTSSGKNFLLVADIKPESKGKTNIGIYRTVAAGMAEALKTWANGDVRGCPDPARTLER
ncbi:MAG: hypothetical protein ACOY5B_07410 [Spirochaetota bacterium]